MTKQAELEELKQIATEAVTKTISEAVRDVKALQVAQPTPPAESAEGSAEEVPTFDTSDLSWGDADTLASVGPRLVKAAEENDFAGAKSLMDELRSFLARLTVSIPRNWLVERAPQEIDWADPASFSWLKQKRIKALVRAMNEAVQGGQEDSLNV